MAQVFKLTQIDQQRRSKSIVGDVKFHEVVLTLDKELEAEVRDDLSDEPEDDLDRIIDIAAHKVDDRTETLPNFMQGEDEVLNSISQRSSIVKDVHNSEADKMLFQSKLNVTLKTNNNLMGQLRSCDSDSEARDLDFIEAEPRISEFEQTIKSQDRRPRSHRDISPSLSTRQMQDFLEQAKAKELREFKRDEVLSKVEISHKKPKSKAFVKFVHIGLMEKDEPGILQTYPVDSEEDEELSKRIKSIPIYVYPNGTNPTLLKEDEAMR